MNISNFKGALMGLFAIMFISVAMISCTKQDTALLDPATAVVAVDTESSESSIDDQQRNPFHNPCDGPYEILPNVNSSSHCNLYWGTMWFNNKCYWCW